MLPITISCTKLHPHLRTSHFMTAETPFRFLLKLYRVKLVSRYREGSGADFPAASQKRRAEPASTHSPPAARLPGLCRLLLHHFLLLLLFVTLPPITVLLLSRLPAVPVPLQSSGPVSASGPEPTSVLSRCQLRLQPCERAGGHVRREAPVYEPRHIQPREGQAETERGKTFNGQAHERG